MNQTFTLTAEHIPLNKLLKMFDLAENGGIIKAMIMEGLVYVNGNQELRIRNKLVAGDVVTIPSGDVTITING